MIKNKKFHLLAAITFMALVGSSAASAQVRVRWDWSTFDIVANDAKYGANGTVGNRNAHTMEFHVGKSDSFLRDRTVYGGKKCASTFWTSSEANYWIRGTMKAEDDFRQAYGYPDLWTTIQNQRDYGQIILSRFNFEPNMGWFHGIYIKELGKIYGANGVRIVLKKLPYNFGPDGWMVETAFPAIDPLYYTWCTPDSYDG